MLLTRFFRFSAVLLALSFSIAAQNSAETHTKIRIAVEARDYGAAIGELQSLERADKKIFTLNNYDYLLARMAEKRGDFATAAATYEAVVKRNSVLSEYALWRLSQIARASGNLLLERIYLRQLSALAPDSSLLRDSAAERIARSNFESKDFTAVIGGQWAAAAIINQDKNAPNSTAASPAASQDQRSKIKDREKLVYLGQSYLQLGRLNEAREIFTGLVANLPNVSQPDDFALAAARALDEMDGGRENFGKVAPPLADAEHYRRAQIYQFNRDFPAARLHYAAIVKKYPQFMLASEAMYQIGRGYAQENNFDEAINWFERVQAEFPAQPISRDALSQAASAYSRVNKPREAVSRYQRFIEKYSDAENLDRAYLNIVDVKRDSGEESDALKWTQKTREVFKGKLAEVVALFAAARIRIAQNDWANALADLNELQNFADLGGTRVPGGTNKAEVTFLRGFALENLERYPEAVDVYLSLPDGRGEYYGWRATERLRALAGNEKSSQSVLQKLNALRLEAAQTLSPQNAEIIRQAAQSAIRLTNVEALKNELLDNVKRTYALLPAYQKIPDGKLLEFGRAEVLKDAKQTMTATAVDYHRTLADELLFLGLYDEGTPELDASLKGKNDAGQNTNSNQSADPKPKTQNPKPGDVAYTLAVFYNRGDLANRAIAYLEPLWRSVPADYQVELIPREQARILYPVPYADSLLQHGAPRKIDPRFALSIMRQESRYRPDVKSNAAARGLMQFISTTSDKLAAELGKTDFRQDELYNPPTAILFGSQYLANLFSQFSNQPPAVAASYNGGETNMARWMARSKTNDPDRYVPEIIFTQSKDYVYKVMANYRVYRAFYDENLKAR